MLNVQCVSLITFHITELFYANCNHDTHTHKRTQCKTHTRNRSQIAHQRHEMQNEEKQNNTHAQIDFILFHQINDVDSAARAPLFIQPRRFCNQRFHYWIPDGAHARHALFLINWICPDFKVSELARLRETFRQIIFFVRRWITIEEISRLNVYVDVDVRWTMRNF